jgi:hypothetical protein
VTLQPARATPEEREALTKPFNLRAAFQARQHALVEDLKVTASFTAHSTTIGDAHEADWVAMLRSWLPNRYGIGPIFAVDANGRQSQQIDVGIYDQHYAPSWFETPKGGVQFVPAESVYAVFEVKPEINKTYADYSGDKIASVRALHRTNGGFRHLGGVSQDQDLTTKPILGGILTVRSGWVDMEGKAAADALTGLDDLRRIDLGIALDALSFDISQEDHLEFSEPGLQLIFFAMRLFERLQGIGTAVAVEISEYERYLREREGASN